MCKKEPYCDHCYEQIHCQPYNHFQLFKYHRRQDIRIIFNLLNQKYKPFKVFIYYILRYFIYRNIQSLIIMHSWGEVLTDCDNKVILTEITPVTEWKINRWSSQSNILRISFQESVCDCNRAFDLMFYENYEILDSRSLEWADRQMLYLLRKRKSLFNKMNTY